MAYCPRCRSDLIRRSHRRTKTEKYISLIGVFPLRCRACGERFFKFITPQWLRRLRHSDESHRNHINQTDATTHVSQKARGTS